MDYQDKVWFEQLELLDDENIEMILSRYNYYTDESDDVSISQHLLKL